MPVETYLEVGAKRVFAGALDWPGWCRSARREEVLGAGGRVFEPMPGRPMREYVVLPEAWREEPDRIRDWVARSLDHADELPPKQPKTKK